MKRPIHPSLEVIVCPFDAHFILYLQEKSQEGKQKVLEEDLEKQNSSNI